MDERNLSVIIANLISTKQEEAYFSVVIRQSAQADTILSCKRHQYVAEFKDSPTISEYARMAQSRLDGVLEIERTLGSFLASQTAITEAYLKEINLLGSHLRSIQEVYAVNKADIIELKSRQDRIFRHHHWLNISPGDEKIFSEIVKETYSPGMETEMAHYVRVLTEIVNAGQSDAHRIMDLRESEKIIPIETHTKEYRKMAEGFQGFHSRIIWWKEVQQKYLDNIDRSEKSLLFRIKETVSGKFMKLFLRDS
jgi:hypothetical protein